MKYRKDVEECKSKLLLKTLKEETQIIIDWEDYPDYSCWDNSGEPPDE